MGCLFPNGQTRSYSYDDQGRLLQLANAHPTTGNLATYAYGYDLNNATSAYTMLGQRTSLTATVPAQSFSSALTKYYYDNLYQLTRVDYPSAAPFNGEVHSWTYDAIGNRLTNTVNAVTQNYTYQKIGTNPNNWQRLTSDGTNSNTYDANGNTATRTGYTFGWDYENRMNSITGTPSATYGYDYSGRRSSKTVSAAATSYLYNGLNLVSETAGATTTYHLFGSGVDEPLASSRGASVVYQAVDALGSVALTTNPVGATQNSYVFDGWGVSRSSSETFAQPFRFTAREVGDAAGQSFHRARFLALSVGRFLSEDPLRLYGSGHLRRNNILSVSDYVYVENSPVMGRDPLGLERPTNTDILNCVLHPFECNTVSNRRAAAYNATLRRFGHQGHNDASDAYRHCFWSCCIAETLGNARAQVWTDGHENEPNNPQCEKNMDCYNNEQGRRGPPKTLSYPCSAHCAAAPLQNAPVGSCKPAPYSRF